MKKKIFFQNLIIKVVLCILVASLSIFSILDKLDFRLYDSLFKIRKDVPKNEKILMVEVDDDSILLLGEWPWTRDIIADSLLRMKELGALYAIFDIEYIQPSQYGISPSAPEKISENINQTSAIIENTLNLISQNIGSDYYSEEDLKDIITEAKNSEINPQLSYLNDFIHNSMYRDNDDYFARAIQFFGNTFLTVNNQDLGYVVTEEEAEYIKQRLLYHNVDDKKNLIIKDNDYTSIHSYDGFAKGFQPALHSLIDHSAGVGFTNSVVDVDGVRRRFEVLYEYDGSYLGQLSIAPLIKILDVQKIVRKSNCYILEGAVLPGKSERQNIKIPVDKNGRMLINWRKGRLNNSFNHESIISLVQLDQIEENIINTLKNITSSYVYDFETGEILDYYNNAVSLLEFYNLITDYKEYLLSLCTGFDVTGQAYDGITDSQYDEYFTLRNEFFEKVSEFLNSDYLPEIKTQLENNISGYKDEEIELLNAYFDEDFSALKGNYDLYISYIEDLRNKYEGTFCIIGNTAASTTDLGATPIREKFENVGLHANVMNTVLNQTFIKYVNWYWPFIICIIFSFALLLFVNKEQHIQNIIGGAGVIVITIVWVLLFMIFDIYMPFIPCLLFIAIDYVLCVIIRFVASNNEKKFITQVAASFANKDTVEQLKKHPELFTTKGEKKSITALFSDVQKFSTLSETLGMIYGDDAPSKLVEILNEYLGDMSNEILYNNGTIDKYEGDAIISMFGAPDTMNLHTKEEWAYLCIDSAIRMKKREELFNKTHKDLFIPVDILDKDNKVITVELKPLQTRIGINSGEAFVGMMGSKTSEFSKLNYTMMGDTVNLASRLEGVNKVYKSWIMCSGETWNLADSGVNKGKILAKKLDKVRVVGRSTPVQLYNILGYTSEASPELLQELEVFNAAMEEYFSGNFLKAGQLFIQASDIYADETAVIYANRCKEFIENGVPENWDGVVSMTSK